MQSDELLKSEEIFRINQLYAIIENCYDGIYITDGQANTLLVNKAYEKITGMKVKEMVGRNMRYLEKNKYISKSGTLMVLDRGKSVTIEQIFKTGKKVLVSSNPIFDDNGDITMVVTNVRDVTELYELKEQLNKNKKLAEKYYSQVEAMRKQLLNFTDLIAEDDNMIRTLEMAKKVSKVDTTVILLGETGVGKEKVAKYIHKNSNRSGKGFIKIDCGSIPDNLIESELFGYEGGAFTGAKKDGKIGLFELADGGTIFLDEVGELPLNMQVKLLRVLQESEIKRVGGVNTIKIDVRIISATNRNLRDMVRRKTFREDLYYRINVVPITIAPLRERKEDIEPLIEHFLSTFNKKYDLHKVITCGAIDSLKEYKWPGNVRELKNIIERLVIMSSGDKILRSDLPIKEIWGNSKSGLEIASKNITLKEAVEKVEKSLIESAFEKHGNVRDAAAELGINASTLVRKRKRYRNKNLE
ncbi:sigma-54 interaction domain-containing protein [Clostridium tyrobutyricum]|uniref:sigma-54 interaction domain-containing protein n=1 Tax=Clostridium tyrobutyricum TaxID=1519 RepID=UPI0011CB558A|nr:sigma 54-interacting transcriptional regulator [Clostridium tyrobutyricum]MBV4427043.1 sigma 54-interacting transcriptional regulator [Clostridium tyrobutyricum]MBV4443667.1 sigma 54-interacting transcriptional regulator [Clostridium tyrobutyricum]